MELRNSFIDCCSVITQVGSPRGQTLADLPSPQGLPVITPLLSLRCHGTQDITELRMTNNSWQPDPRYLDHNWFVAPVFLSDSG